MAENEELPPTASVVEDGGAGVEDLDEPDEFSVEAVKGKRKNPRTGLIEYLIKWQDYPDSANSWEPVDNLSCPDLILKFNEAEKSKRKRRSTESQTKRSKKLDESRSTTEPILLEDELDNISTTETLSSTDSAARERQKELESAARQPKGFERGVQIEKISGSTIGDDDRLYFFVKWQGVGEIELVESTEMEDKAPRFLCGWYRERLYYMIKNPSDLDPK